MSTHALPEGIDNAQLRALLTKRLRAPSGVVFGNGMHLPPTALEFEPDLIAEEEAVLAKIVDRVMADEW